MKWLIFPDPAKTAEACAHQIAERLEEALRGQAKASIAISGGSSPKQMFTVLAASGLDWSRVHLFWVDERAVPPDHPDSNYGMTVPLLIEPAGIPASNVHRIHGELQPDEASRQYADDIASFFELDSGQMPQFDVVHCGTGPDGHTASLFPGERLIEDRERISSAVYSEPKQQWRVTLLPGALLAARHTVFFATGQEKAATLQAVLEGAYDPNLYPAQVIARHGNQVTWFLDQGAGKLLG